MDEIKLSPSAYQTIITHALTHEKEEIIGLLFAEECGKHIQIFAAKPCPRITHLPDRVEMSDQELADGIQEAEKLKEILGRNIKVLGWYHSHPHTTVHPSDHDIAAQKNYETLNPRFFGIIVSVFSDGKGTVINNEKHQTTRITSFRSDGEGSTKLTIEPIQNENRSDLPFALFQTDVNNWLSIPSIFFKEIENESAYDRIARITQLSGKIVFPMATICDELTKSLLAKSRIGRT
ncbi:hypothetical protein Aperf_G00000023353 [Anoplocephala perfoliata]